jgi:hypothetical protein
MTQKVLLPMMVVLLLIGVSSYADALVLCANPSGSVVALDQCKPPWPRLRFCQWQVYLHHHTCGWGARLRSLSHAICYRPARPDRLRGSGGATCGRHRGRLVLRFHC